MLTLALKGLAIAIPVILTWMNMKKSKEEEITKRYIFSALAGMAGLVIMTLILKLL